MNIITYNYPNVILSQGTYNIPTLPLPMELENKKVMKKTSEARAALAELKGVAISMPNQNILIKTLSLQEAKDSSAIENIVTTNDELYQSDEKARYFVSHAAKEVHLYATALIRGFSEIKKSGLLRNNLIKSMQSELLENDSGFRSQAGTTLKEQITGNVIYTPPQSLAQIENAMKNLEDFINDKDLSDLDALVKMAIIHHQFESIHPFFDGNGRTGRMINVLYLVHQQLLDTPILYLSRYINHNKQEYYRLLQAVRDQGIWEEWIMFMLEGICHTSRQTICLIEEIKIILQKHKNTMRTKIANIYTQDLLNIMFNHPYTKIAHVVDELKVSRQTAAKCLDAVTEIGLMQKVRIQNSNYYFNNDLIKCLSNVHDM